MTNANCLTGTRSDNLRSNIVGNRRYWFFSEFFGLAVGRVGYKNKNICCKELSFVEKK